MLFRLSMITSNTLTRIQPIRTTSNNFPAGVSDSKMMTYSFRFNFSSCRKSRILSFSFIYVFSFFGIVDLLATLPLYIGLLFPGARYLLIIRAFRLIRVFRVFKLFNFLNEGERLLTALRESSKKIAVFFLFVVILVTSIGTLMYMIEGTQPDSQFNNIPNSIYWAIVTMTTVGYGDITPVTGFGKFLSACVMLIGYTIIAVPTGIVSASMMKDYKRRRDKECPHCHRSGHEDNAGFCKYCGSSLNPKDEMQVKPEDESKDNT